MPFWLISNIERSSCWICARPEKSKAPAYERPQKSRTVICLTKPSCNPTPSSCTSTTGLMVSRDPFKRVVVSRSTRGQAFRERIRKAHPDAGGSPEEFKQATASVFASVNLGSLALRVQSDYPGLRNS